LIDFGDGSPPEPSGVVDRTYASRGPFTATLTDAEGRLRGRLGRFDLAYCSPFHPTSVYAMQY
jgi:hypothetical protein